MGSVMFMYSLAEQHGESKDCSTSMARESFDFFPKMLFRHLLSKTNICSVWFGAVRSTLPALTRGVIASENRASSCFSALPFLLEEICS